MKKLIPVILSVTVSVVCVLTAFNMSLENSTADSSLTFYVTPVAADADETEISITTSAEHTPKSDADFQHTSLNTVSPEKIFENMLDINYCYGESFASYDKMTVATAVTLFDYADDLPDSGLSVSSALIKGFIKSFYGKDADSDAGFGAYVTLPCIEVESQFHSVISLTECDGYTEVVSRVTFYSCGDDITVRNAVSRFVKSPRSEFGYNLISCELL